MLLAKNNNLLYSLTLSYFNTLIDLDAFCKVVNQKEVILKHININSPEFLNLKKKKLQVGKFIYFSYLLS